MKTSIKYLGFVGMLILGVTMVRGQTQPFVSGTVPQTISYTARSNTQCVNDPSDQVHRGINNRAFYQGQNRYFYSTLRANNNSNTLRIFNDGTAASTKVFVYNPFGALSPNTSTQGAHSYVSNFGFKSNIKPSGIERVYVAYQNNPTYMAGIAPQRTTLAGQIVHNVWRRPPLNVSAGGLTYNYLDWSNGFPGGVAGSINLSLTYTNSAPRSDLGEFLCTNIYIAHCGDGVVDNVNKPGGNNTNGKQGMQIGNNFVQRADPNPGVINEVCDNGDLNSNTTPGACKMDCSGYVPVPVQPVCDDISFVPSNPVINQPVSVVCNASNATYYNMTIAGPGTPLSTNTNNATYTPTLPGTYTITCTVYDDQYQQPSTCTAETFIIPDNTPYCLNLTATPDPVDVGSPVTIQCEGNNNANTYTVNVLQGGNTINTFNGFLNGPNYTSTNTFVPNSPGTYTINCGVGFNNTSIDYCQNQTVVVSQPGSPSLWINKVATPTVLDVGDMITFTITFGNNGNATATDLTLQDFLPDSLQYISHSVVGITPLSTFDYPNPFGSEYIAGFSGFDLAPGQQGTMTITAQAINHTGSMINVATIFNDTLQATDDASFVINPPAPGQLILDKKQDIGNGFTDNTVTVDAGDTITYQVTIQNIGGSPYSNIYFQDILPVGIDYVNATITVPGNPGVTLSTIQIGGQDVVTSTPFSLAAGNTATITITAQVAATQNNMTYTNTAQILSFITNSVIDQDTVHAILTVDEDPSLILDKYIINQSSSYQAGDVITYHIDFENIGSGDALDVYINDILPSTVTYVNSSIVGVNANISVTTINGHVNVMYGNFTLAPGQSGTLIITGVINENTCLIASGGTPISTLNVVQLFSSNHPTLTDTATFACSPVPTIDKKQKVGNGSFTDNQITVSLGDTITYQITIANIGNTATTNAILTDLLPNGLQYISHTNTPTMTFSQATVGNSTQLTFSNISLAAGQSEIITITAQVVGNGVGNLYTNQATLEFFGPYQSVQDNVTAVRIFGANVQFTKSLLGPTSYQAGDDIHFSLQLTNNGPDTISNVTIQDVWPENCVDFTSHTVTPNTTAFAITNNPYARTLSTLPAGNSIVLNLFGTINGNAGCAGTHYNTGNASYTLNGNQYTIQRVVSFVITEPDVSLEKTVDLSQANIGDVLTYTLSYENSGNSPFTSFTITDTLPSNVNFGGVVSNSHTPSNTTVNGSTIVWNFTGTTLNAGQGGQIVFTGIIIDNSPNTAVNNAEICVGTVCDDDDASTTILAPTCGSLNATNGTVALVQNNNAGLEFVCTTADGQAADITIDCGNGDSSTIFGSTMTYTCTYNSNNIGNTYPVTCSVDGQTNSQCQDIVIVDEPFLAQCGNGIREGYEQCDITNSSYANGVINGYPVIGNWLDNGITPAPSYLQGSYCQSCSIQSLDDPFVYQPPACWGVNTNISASKGEILPFWRELEIDEDRLTSSYNCVQPNSIPVETLECDFAVYKNMFENPIYTRTTDCYEDQWNDVLFDYFENQYATDVSNAVGKYYFPLGEAIQEFGEYKLILEAVRYDYCDDNANKLPDTMVVQRVCEVNFAATRPYYLQRNAFGGTQQTSSVDLSDFYTLDGDPILNATDLADIMVLDESYYNGGIDITQLMDELISRYSALAVEVTNQSILNLFNLGAGVTISKVPGQQVYIFEGSNNNDRIVLNELNSFAEPFTMIVRDMDLIVKGSITQSNGLFVVKNGKVSFAEPDVNRCAARQVVNGLFVTNSGFGVEDSGLTINNSLGSQRCNEGGLTIRGALIGPGIQDLVNQRRSHLNHWFRVDSFSEAAIRRERRNEILAGAAVLIEFNPSLIDQLPPGLESFTTLLDVYRQ